MMAAMEPDLTAAPELAGVLDELRRREPIFHRPEFGSARADFERMAAADCLKIAACAIIYGKSCIHAHLSPRRQRDSRSRRHP